MSVALRAIEAHDHDELFELMRDPASVWMAAFTSKDPDDRAAFDAWIARVLISSEVTMRAVTDDGRLVGSIASYVEDGVTELTYWIGRADWGRGIASRALALFLGQMTVRPLQARAASDNHRSLKVLEKAGFRSVGTEVSYAAARDAEIEETILVLQR